MRLRLYLDEDFNGKLAPLLRSRGCDAVSSHEVGNDGLQDRDQLRFAAAAGRAILTCNHSDFRDLDREWRLSGQHHAGIVLSFHQCSDDELGVFAGAVEKLVEVMTAELLADIALPLDAFR